MKSSLYSPLPFDHIRILIVNGTSAVKQDSGLTDLAIDCSLVTVPLDDVRSGVSSYRALSYVWGSEYCTRQVTCNGIQMEVTASLYNALWHLITKGESGEPLRLWVDALCIDQGSVEDKNQQVAKMHDIYRCARTVLVWLGAGAEQGGEELDKFWDYVESLSSNKRSWFRSPAMSLKPDPAKRDAIRKAGRSFLSSCEWFRRIWTFQEIVLAQSAIVVRGHHHVAWEHLVKFVQASPSEMAETDHLGQLLESIQAMKRERRCSLRKLMWYSRGRQAKNPHDRVYSLLGLYKGVWEFGIDYSQSVQITYAQYLIAMSAEEGCLDDRLLYWPSANPSGGSVETRRLFGRGDKPLQRWRSWIPDWNLLSGDNSNIRFYSPTTPTSVLDMRLLHPSFAPKLRLSNDCFEASGVLIRYSVAWENSATRPQKISASFKDAGSPPCVKRRSFQTGPLPVSPSRNFLLDRGRYVPIQQDAKDLWLQLWSHECGKCGCAKSTSTLVSLIKKQNDGLALQVQSGWYMRWMCYIFGTERPVVLDPLYNPETDEFCCVLVDIDVPPKYTTMLTFLSERTVYAGERTDHKTSEYQHVFNDESDSDDDTGIFSALPSVHEKMELLTLQQRKKLHVHEWQTPEDVPVDRSNRLCWLPAIFTICGSETHWEKFPRTLHLAGIQIHTSKAKLKAMHKLENSIELPENIELERNIELETEIEAEKDIELKRDVLLERDIDFARGVEFQKELWLKRALKRERDFESQRDNKELSSSSREDSEDDNPFF